MSTLLADSSLIVDSSAASNDSMDDSVHSSSDEEPVYGEPGMTCETKNLYQGPSEYAWVTNWVDEYPEDLKKTNMAESERYALIVKNEKSNERGTALKINSILVQSPLLKEFLRGTAPDNPEFLLRKVTLRPPFNHVFYHWAEIREAASSHPEEQTRAHIQLLAGVLKKDIEEIEERFNDLISQSLITFDYLWALFTPKCTFKIHYSYIGWDGKNFIVRTKSVDIEEFKGPKKIEDLPMYPYSFTEGHAEVRGKVLARGERFCSLTGTHYMMYKGTAYTAKGLRSPIHVDGRVVIDADAYYQYNPKRISTRCLFQGKGQDADTEPRQRESNRKLSDEQLLVCASTVRGYSLTHKLWVKLDVERLSEITWREDAFANLILPGPYKELIMSFVEAQLGKTDNFDDLIAGKGQGVIMLLAGPPGIGKTLTAESVAEEMHVPLYSMTAGELGSHISEVERSLRQILNLAAKWRAVLLLDEADVFLEQRSSDEVERNKLVSVFLRTVEYFKGILFLTTNRVESIDTAFKSRIHLSLNYPSLSRPSQKAIWRNSINRSLGIDNGTFLDDDLDSFTERQMNGREIKNAVKLSNLLARRRQCTGLSDIARPAQYAFKIKALHRKYGPVVRIGPNDVSISDTDLIDAVYAPGPGHKRDKDSRNRRALGINSSIGGSITHDLHRNRREPLNPFFSPQRIHRLDPDLAAKAARVEDIFANARDNGQILNLSDVYFAFCNDVVHKYCFGSDSNLLGNLPLASARRNNVVSVLRGGKIMFHFSWIRRLLQWLPGGPGAHGMMIFRRRIRAQIDAVLARDSSSDEAPSIFTHLRDSMELPAAEKSPQRLEDEAVLMTMAGTYSPMLSLLVAHYHLLTRPDVMAKLRAELGVHGSTPAAAELDRLPYLSAIMQEAHRLTFGLTGRNARVCPDEPIVYKDKKKPGQTYVFPPGTSLSVSTLVIHTDESLFPNPWVFDPDRWLPPINIPAPTDKSVTKEQKEGQDAASLLISCRRRSMLSFNRGPRVCIGRHLANAEIAVLLAVMARWDLELFETDEDDIKYKHDYHVMSPKLGSKGIRVKVQGKASILAL